MRRPQQTTRALLRPFAALALASYVAPSAVAAPATDYLALRRKIGYDRKLTYSEAARDWIIHVGKAFEVAGTLNGHMRSQTGVAFMITMADGTALTLEAPPADHTQITQATASALRVLVRIREGSLGNVVPLETIATADDGEVRFRERLAQEREARLAAQAAARRAPRPPQTPASYGVQGSNMRVRPIAGTVAGLSEMARKYLSPEAQSIYQTYARFIAGWNKRLRPDQVDAIAVSILYFADRHRVDPRLIVALIIAESDFNPQSTSHKGAMGLGQVMPDEARAFRLTNPYDPIQNVRVSVNMLRMKLDMYREQGVPNGQMTMRQISLAMAAYNAGAGAVKKHGGIPPYRETQRYVQRVLKLYTAFCRG
jgi:soluble lytic murein transglycosylase-like protein